MTLQLLIESEIKTFRSDQHSVIFEVFVTQCPYDIEFD